MKKIVLLAFVLVLLSTSMIGRVTKPVEASGTITIKADGIIDPPDAPINTTDTVTYYFTDDINDSIVVERSNIIIDGNGYTLQGLGSGIGFYLSDVNNVTITQTTVNGFGDGVYLRESSNNSIFENNIMDNENGILILYYSSINNNVYGNNFKNNTGAGIGLSSSSYNNISDNYLKANRIGIDLSGSDSNCVAGNNLINNTYGIRLGYSSNNIFYHNNFINNEVQVSDPLIPTSINVWDDGYPSGGNYWSDYYGVDEKGGPNQDQPGRDGIGDTPYDIYEDRDRYPLMIPWPWPEHELVVSIMAPSSITLGGSSSLNATVINEGLNDEVDVELVLLINGTVLDSTTISLLQAGNSYTLTYLWTPTVEGTYNVTAFAHPVPGETSVENNQMSKFVTVSAAPTPPEVQVGVEAGDWIKYDYTVSGAPSGTPLPTWMKVEFLSVEGANATVRVTMHMSDGTEQNDTVTINIVAGEGTLGSFSGFVIPANRTTGDSVYMSGYGNVTIASETTRTYAGASRTVVFASFSQYGSQLTYYWDKETGVMAEASTTSGGVTGTAKATETNMWEAVPSPFWMQWWLWAIVAAVIVALAGTIYFLKKRKPPTPTASPLPTEGTLQNIHRAYSCHSHPQTKTT